MRHKPKMVEPPPIGTPDAENARRLAHPRGGKCRFTIDRYEAGEVVRSCECGQEKREKHEHSLTRVEIGTNRWTWADGEKLRVFIPLLCWVCRKSWSATVTLEEDGK